MNIISKLLGNASSVSPDLLKKEYGELLITDCLDNATFATLITPTSDPSDSPDGYGFFDEDLEKPLSVPIDIIRIHGSKYYTCLD